MMHARPPLQSPLARWSRTVAVFSLQLVVVAIVLHRLYALPTPVAINIVAGALAGAALAILLALLAYVAIWRDGRLGALNAGIGMLVGLGLIAWPASVLPIYQKLPELNDITTDATAPPAFAALAAVRATANGAAYPGREAAEQQLAAYPDIRPVIVPRPVNETWEILGETVRRLRWRVASEQPPEGNRAGKIEAVDRTLVLGFYDDIVVRVTGDASETRIDVRSASRFGRHDFGRNASRVRLLYKELAQRLEETVSGSERRRRRARPSTAVPKRGKASPAAEQRQGKGQPVARRSPPPR